MNQVSSRSDDGHEDSTINTVVELALLECSAVLEVEADLHGTVIPQCITWQSVAHANKQVDQWYSMQSYHLPNCRHVGLSQQAADLSHSFLSRLVTLPSKDTHSATCTEVFHKPLMSRVHGMLKISFYGRPIPGRPLYFHPVVSSFLA